MQMRRLTRGKNIVAAGYESGTLRVAFGKSGEYDYSGVPEDKFVSLCRVPYPDNYYSKSIKGKFPCVKVADPPEEPLKALPLTQPRKANEMEIFFPQDGVEFIETDPATGQSCHYYTLKGQRIPFSLTQVLELSGISRQPSSATEVAARPAAAKRGTKVHEYTLWLDQGELDLEDLKLYPEYYNRVIGWQQFREDFHFEPDLTKCEVPIAVRVNGMLYAMKLDAYGVIGEGEKVALAVVEKKCTADAEDSHAIQTAGQAIAFKSHAESVQLPLRRYCVYLFDKPNAANRYYRVMEHGERSDEKIFAAALTTVHWRAQHGLLNGRG